MRSRFCWFAGEGRLDSVGLEDWEALHPAQIHPARSARTQDDSRDDKT